MKAIVWGLSAMVLISVGAYFGLQEMGFDAGTRNAGDAVRLD